MRPYLRPVLLGAAISALILSLGFIAIGYATGGTRPQASARAAPIMGLNLPSTPTPTATSTQTPIPRSTSTPIPQPTGQRPTPTPTAALGRTQLDNYTRVVTEDSARLQQALSAMTANCRNGDVSVCRGNMEDVARESQRFTHDLDVNPAPLCLQAADAERRQALRDYEAGARQGIQGIDTNNISLIVKSGDTIIQGSDHMNRATALTRDASC